MARPASAAGALPLLLEAAAALGVAFGDSSLALGLHLSAATLTALLCLSWVKGGSRRSAALAAALIVSALPLVGASIFSLVLWPSWMRRQSSQAPAVIEVPLSDALAEADGFAATAPGQGRPFRELLQGDAPPEERVRAVMALRHMDARHAVPLLRLAFASDSEDVRLLAFAILERREKQLRARIKLTERRLALRPGADAASSSARAAWHRRLARDNWELVYGNFISPDLKGVVLEAAARHASAALDHGLDAPTAVLLARIRLAERRPADAWAYLERAEQAGATPATCAPLFAEAAYMLRRFGEIPALLSRAKPQQLRRPELGPVAQFWTEPRQP